MKDLPAYCQRHGYVMPAEFLIAVMNGKDPRTGADVEDTDLDGTITLTNSLDAAKTLAKYLYATASKVELSGDAEIKIPDIKVSEGVAESLAEKLAEKLK